MNMKSVALKMLKTGHGYNKELQFNEYFCFQDQSNG